MFVWQKTNFVDKIMILLKRQKKPEKKEIVNFVLAQLSSKLADCKPKQGKSECKTKKARDHSCTVSGCTVHYMCKWFFWVVWQSVAIFKGKMLPTDQSLLKAKALCSCRNKSRKWCHSITTLCKKNNAEDCPKIKRIFWEIQDVLHKCFRS